MRLVTSAKAGQWIKATNTYERIMATAATKSMRQVGTSAAKAGTDVIRNAGFTSRKWDLKAKHFPATGYVLNPAEWVHSKTNFLDVFQEGKTIVGKPWLWLPLPSVPKWPGDPTRQMSPKKYTQTIGPLVTMRRPGKPPLLGAIVRGLTRPQPFGRFATRTRLRRGAGGSGRISLVPMFVGVHSATIAKKFDTTKAIENAFNDLPTIYVKNLQPYEGRR